MGEQKTGPDAAPRSGLDTGRQALEHSPDSPPASDDRQDDLVDVGSEESFPASDPPSYMGGTVVSGSPSHDGTVREGVSRTLVNPSEAKPAGDAPQGTDPARVGKAPSRPGYGGNQ
jgi:hypothetical protein